MAIHSECSSAETGEVRFIHSYLALIQLAIATEREYTRRLLWLLLGLLWNFWYGFASPLWPYFGLAKVNALLILFVAYLSFTGSTDWVEHCTCKSIVRGFWQCYVVGNLRNRPKKLNYLHPHFLLSLLFLATKTILISCMIGKVVPFYTRALQLTDWVLIFIVSQEALEFHNKLTRLCNKIN